MARKLEFMHGSFKDLHNRLMGNSSGVAPELTVEIERTTLRAIKLKNLIEEKVRDSDCDYHPPHNSCPYKNPWSYHYI